jgi:hypothetical protein
LSAKKFAYVASEIYTAVVAKRTLACDMTPCIPLDSRSFGQNSSELPMLLTIGANVYIFVVALFCSIRERKHNEERKLKERQRMIEGTRN